MGLSTIWRKRQPPQDDSVLIEATIPVNATQSEWLDLGRCAPAGLFMPSAWNAATLSFQTALDASGTGADALYDPDTNVLLTAQVSADRYYPLPPARFLGVRFLRLVSSAPQTSARLLRIVAEP